MMSFEQEWREKMLHANVNPNDNVWEGISLHLAQKQKKKYKKKYLVWWVAAMFPLLLGDGQFLLFYKNGSTSPIQNNIPIEKSVQSYTIVTHPPLKDKAVILQEVPSQNKFEFTAVGGYELESQKVLSKKVSEEKVLEALGKPKSRRFWLQTYSALENSHQKFIFHSLAPMASRSPFVNPAIALAEKRVKDELSSYTPLLSWRIGLDVGYQINKNWYIASGLHFTRSISSIDVDAQNKYPEIAKFYGKIPVMPTPTTTIPVAIVTPNTETITPENQDFISFATLTAPEPKTRYNKFIQKMDYLSIPLKIGYQVQKNRFRYAVAVGAEGSYLLNNTFSSQNIQINQVTEHLNRCQVSALAEISVGLTVSDKTLLHISPTFRKSLISPFAINSPLQQTQNFTVGLSGGVQYRF